MSFFDTPLGMQPLNGVTRSQLIKELKPLGMGEVHAQRIFSWLYRNSPPQTWQGLSVAQRYHQALAKSFSLPELPTAQTQLSSDAIKGLLILADGASIESVYIPKSRRVTLCVSSQVGCSLDCRFCVTADLGFKRNLKTHEIVDQVLWAKQNFARPVDNVVFMGMGEPFYNLSNVLQAVDILCDPFGLAVPRRKVTVSTAGVIPGIQAWAKQGRTSLAVSLICIDSHQRSQLMSINQRYPLADVLQAIAQYIEETGQKVLCEYLLIKDLTDDLSQAEQLAKRLAGMQVTVNLIPYNPSPSKSFLAPHREQVLAFQSAVKAGGVFCTVRWSAGGDIAAACGQLAGTKVLNAVQPGNDLSP